MKNLTKLKKTSLAIALACSSIIVTTAIVLPKVNLKNEDKITEQPVSKETKEVFTPIQQEEKNVVKDNKIAEKEEIVLNDEEKVVIPEEEVVDDSITAVSDAVNISTAIVETKPEEEVLEPARGFVLPKKDEIPEVQAPSCPVDGPTVEEPQDTPKLEEPSIDLPQVEEPQDTPKLEEPSMDLPQVEEPEEEEVLSKQESVSKEPEYTQDELIAKVKEAVTKTKSVNSVYFIRKRTGIYPGEEKIKYNKNQNRQWYLLNDDIEEYTEGKEGNYPPVTGNGRVSSYYAQTHWQKSKENPEWVKRPSLISYFGISELGFLNNIKAVELKGTRPFAYYIVTLDREVANKAAIDLLNAGYYLDDGMFSKDVTIAIQVDHEGYIRSFDANWDKDVFTKPSVGPITISLHIGELNKTSVSRPSDLKDEPEQRVKPDELTQSKKVEIMNQIYNAFTKTYNVNSATYEVNGVTFKYDLQKNVALMSDKTSQTYYEGKEGNYVDHNYVGPDYFHKIWTKNNTDNVWKQNTSKHKTFTPQELYFLNHSIVVIHDVTKVEKGDGINTYTITILKYGANLAYSHVYGVSNKFDNDITMTVSLDNQGYVRALNADFGSDKLNFKMYNINNTEVVRPTDIIE